MSKWQKPIYNFNFLHPSLKLASSNTHALQLVSLVVEMVAPNRHNGGAQSLLLLAAIFSLSFASFTPSSLSSPSGKPAALHLDELTCEDKFKNAEKFTFNETALSYDIKRLINTYYNWGKLLAVAPSAVTILEKLIVMSYQPKMDFRLNTESLSSGSYEFIKYQNNFQTTLLQISHQGYLAFLNAHVNIDKIRMYNSKVSSHIKDAVRYLMSKNELYIVVLLPISLGRIKEAADGNKMLLHQVDSELRTVIELIQATITCVTITKHVNENELERVELDLKSLSGRRKTRQDVERASALNVAKGNCLEVIQALREGRQELEHLKQDWSKLMEFYSRMGVFVAKATENSIAFIEVVRLIARNRNVLDDDEILEYLLEKIQKANEASFLVRGLSEMYVYVSIKYIMDKIANQGDIMARIYNSQVEIEEIHDNMSGIHDYIKADEISLRMGLVDRQNQIMNEYEWMLDCSSPEDRAFIRKE